MATVIAMLTLLICQAQVIPRGQQDWSSFFEVASPRCRQVKQQGMRGSFVLHIPTFHLLGFCWDGHSGPQNCWDGSQLSPSQTPTNHPSGFIWNFLISVPKRKLWEHMIATFPKIFPTESQQQFRFFCYLGFITFVKGGIFVEK